MNIRIYQRMKWNRTLLIIFTCAGLIPPLIFRIIGWYHGEHVQDWLLFFRTLLTSVITTVTISYGVVKILFWLQNKYPWEQGIFKRLMLEILLTTFFACISVILLSLLSHLLFFKEDLQSSIFNSLIVALIMNFVLVAITEGIFFFRQWKRTAVEAESYKKEHILAQFESLKNQVNPHFLFNSLNTLSSLIDQDKEISKTFLDDLSTVYRYVLQHKDEDLVSLKTELDFIKAYTQLLKKRHGERLIFHFDISEKEIQNGIPPIALQLLIENAVKHNIASLKKPLKVEVFTQDGLLIVRNNLQRKKAVHSTGVGLKNIQNRYKYLSDKSIKISETKTSFEVSIPIVVFTKTP